MGPFRSYCKCLFYRGTNSYYLVDFCKTIEQFFFQSNKFDCWVKKLLCTGKYWCERSSRGLPLNEPGNRMIWEIFLNFESFLWPTKIIGAWKIWLVRIRFFSVIFGNHVQQKPVSCSETIFKFSLHGYRRRKFVKNDKSCKKLGRMAEKFRRKFKRNRQKNVYRIKKKIL